MNYFLAAIRYSNKSSVGKQQNSTRLLLTYINLIHTGVDPQHLAWHNTHEIVFTYQ